MDKCLYEPTGKDEVILTNDGQTNRTSRKPLLRQVFICSCVWNSFFMIGLGVGAPTVVIPQLRREANSTEVVSDEMASWISSAYGYAAVPWFTLCIISKMIGRKYPFFIVNVATLTSFIVLCCSRTATHILIAEILQGALMAGNSTISVMIVVEYTSPKHRGLFLSIKSASFNWGMWVANAMGTFFHWRTIAIAGIICSLFNFISILFWCESPAWLASKSRFEECAKVHRWLKGEDAESEKELADLIRSCKEYKEQHNMNRMKERRFWIRLSKTLSKKEFHMPILLSLAILTQYHATGKLVVNIYAIDIIKKITSKESTAYTGMLLLDGVTVVGVYTGCALSKFVKRRVLFLTGSLGGISFLFMLALYLYLCNLNILKENMYVSLFFLTLFFLFISVGPLILCTSIFSELMPLQYRCSGMFILGIFSSIEAATFIKTGLRVFKYFNLHGAFLFYGICSFFMFIYLYKYLPETKDKTLQEIEGFFRTKEKKEQSVEVELMCKQ